MPSAQAPPLKQGLGAQSSRLVAQVRPPKPSGQAHEKSPEGRREQVPRSQGLGAHTSAAQVRPEKPGGHAHEKSFTRSVQVPPFWQGSPAHSSTSISQSAPS